MAHNVVMVAVMGDGGFVVLVVVLNVRDGNAMMETWWLEVTMR